MNIKYIFRSDQQAASPILNPDVYSSASGYLYPGEDTETFSRNLQLIEARIDSIQKELSYWDLYKITSKVTDPQELDSVYNDLIVGQSLVIECASFTSNDGQDLHRGDVIVKLSSNEAALIYAVSSGFYVPNIATAQGQVVIRYDYQEGQPLPSQQSIVASVSLGTASNSFIYGCYANISSSTQYIFPKYVYGQNQTLIRPIVKFFTEENNQLEEVVLNEALPSLVGASWSVSFSDKPSVVKLIQVK